MMTHKTDFERLAPSRSAGYGSTANLVRAAFQKSKEAVDEFSSPTFRLKLYIGKEIARKFQWKDGDKVAIEVSKSDPRTLRLVKTDPTDLQAYKLWTQKGQQYYQLTFTWRKFTPEQKECMSRIIQYAPSEGGLIVYLH